MPQANGGVFQSPSLHAYANTVQTSPKLFTFAQGGVFAEAGPEAVMPLTRDANGRLGVEATGASGDTYITYNVDAKGAKPGVEEAIIMALKDLNDNLESRAIRAVVSEANKGGSFAKAVGRR
jgi:phage-related minor tail protein